MNKVLITAAVVVATLSPALASSHYETMYHDNIRPHGHPRADAVYKPRLTTATARPGSRARTGHASLQGLHGQRTTIAGSIPGRCRTPEQAGDERLQKGHYIDPDTGLICHIKAVHRYVSHRRPT